MSKWQGHLIIAVLLLILAEFHVTFWAWWYVVLSFAFVAMGAFGFFNDVNMKIADAFEDEDENV